jgi:hypothetical protein
MHAIRTPALMAQRLKTLGLAMGKNEVAGFVAPTADCM